MPRGHFTVGDVDALVPTLERIFRDVLQLRAALRAMSPGAPGVLQIERDSKFMYVTFEMD